MACEGFPEEDYGLYALGCLTGPPLAAIEEHLAGKCPKCMSEISQYRALWPAVGAAVPLVEPSRRLRRRVIQSVGGRAAWWENPGLVMGLAAAALVLVVAGGVMVVKRPLAQIAFSPVYRVEVPAVVGTVAPGRTEKVEVPVVRTETVVQTVDNPAQAKTIASLNDDLARERARLAELQSQVAAEAAAVKSASKMGDDSARRVAALDARAQELERQVAQYRVLLDTERQRADRSAQVAGMLTDPSLRVVRLRGTERANQVEGHALIAGNSRMVFYASQLPALPANRVYQLWLIRDNGQAIASAGTFRADASHRGSVELRNQGLLTGVTTLAVTDEPAGGSEQPTGNKWLIGS